MELEPQIRELVLLQTCNIEFWISLIDACMYTSLHTIRFEVLSTDFFYIELKLDACKVRGEHNLHTIHFLVTLKYNVKSRI